MLRDMWQFRSKWLTYDWYAYLFAPASDYYSDMTFWRTLKCRLQGYPRGEIYYNSGGLEPNGHCKDCGDEIA